MRNVDGLFRVQQALRAWILEHASGQSQDFCDAYAARVFHTCEVAARYLFEISEADMYAYRQGSTCKTVLISTCISWSCTRPLKGCTTSLKGRARIDWGDCSWRFPVG